MERGEFVKILHLLNLSDESIEAWKGDSRGPKVLQVNLVIRVDGHVRSLFLGLGDLSRWKVDKERSKRDASTWKTLLREKLLSGQPGVSEFA